MEVAKGAERTHTSFSRYRSCGRTELSLDMAAGEVTSSRDSRFL